MPNWTFNHVSIRGTKEEIAKIKEELYSEGKYEDGSEYKRVFDFNSIIPMPTSLNVTSGSTTNIDLFACLSAGFSIPFDIVMKDPKKNLVFKDSISRMGLNEEWYERQQKAFEECSPSEKLKSIRQGRIYYDNFINYGAVSWYEWCCDHWGTKWNACDSVIVDEDDDFISFDFNTAWSAPEPIMEALSEKYPKIVSPGIIATKTIPVTIQENISVVF